MSLNQAEFVRADKILKCPECCEEFNVNDVEETTKMNSGKWMHTIAECPNCHEIISIDCEELK
jgi:hypothetical protein